jgi:hypothetical protein
VISLPDDVKCGPKWANAADPLVNGSFANIDSSMNWAEHQRIVCDARLLVASPITHSDPDAASAFRDLQSAYNDNNKTTLKVTKGIHQSSTSKAHMQIRTATPVPGQSPRTETFHLMVDSVSVPGTHPALVDRFHWVGVQFTWEDKTAKQYRFWPGLARRAITGRVSPRKSISFTQLEAHNLAVEAENAARASAQAFDDWFNAYSKKMELVAASWSDDQKKDFKKSLRKEKLKKGQTIRVQYPGRTEELRYIAS